MCALVCNFSRDISFSSLRVLICFGSVLFARHSIAPALLKYILKCAGHSKCVVDKTPKHLFLYGTPLRQPVRPLGIALHLRYYILYVLCLGIVIMIFYPVSRMTSNTYSYIDK